MIQALKNNVVISLSFPNCQPMTQVISNAAKIIPNNVILLAIPRLILDVANSTRIVLTLRVKRCCNVVKMGLSKDVANVRIF